MLLKESKFSKIAITFKKRTEGQWEVVAPKEKKQTVSKVPDKSVIRSNRYGVLKSFGQESPPDSPLHTVQVPLNTRSPKLPKKGPHHRNTPLNLHQNPLLKIAQLQVSPLQVSHRFRRGTLGL